MNNTNNLGGAILGSMLKAFVSALVSALRSLKPIGRGILRNLVPIILGIIVVVVASYAVYFRSPYYTDKAPSTSTVPSKIEPWNADFFHDWQSADHYPNVDGVEWKVSITRLDDGASFEYFVFEETGFKKVGDILKFTNGQSHTMDDGTKVIFFSGPDGWKFIPQ